jgi:predicted short-subunit dehydrogenase-like oxidoreductase (DUF2520 family)
VTTRAEVAAGCAELLLLAVPDRALEPLARGLASAPRVDWRGRTVLHHAGARGPEALAPLARAGAAVGLLHPLQCLGIPALAGEILPGSRARIEGHVRARRAAAALARDVGLVVLRVRTRSPADRLAYHAAAALASNDLVALLDLAVEALAAAGLSRRSALAARVPLSRGTLRQLEQAGPRGALTGPVARGDLGTLAGHLRRLARIDPQGARVHELLSRRLARLVAPALGRGRRRRV